MRSFLGRIAVMFVLCTSLWSETPNPTVDELFPPKDGYARVFVFTNNAAFDMATPCTYDFFIDEQKIGTIGMLSKRQWLGFYAKAGKHTIISKLTPETKDRISKLDFIVMSGDSVYIRNAKMMSLFSLVGANFVVPPEHKLVIVSDDDSAKMLSEVASYEYKDSMAVKTNNPQLKTIQDW